MSKEPWVELKTSYKNLAMGADKPNHIPPSKQRIGPGKCKKCSRALSIYNLNDLCNAHLLTRRKDPRFVTTKPSNGWRYTIGG